MALYGPLTREQQDCLRSIAHHMIHDGLRVFVILDGSFYDGIQNRLTKAGLVHRALYKQGGNADMVAGGPWLVNPYQVPPDPDILKGRDRDENGNLYSPEELSARLADEMNAAIAAGDPSGNGLLPYDNYQDRYSALNRIEQIIRLVDGNLTGMVVWCGKDLNGESLYSHLRGLNRILMPKDAQADATALGGQAGSYQKMSDGSHDFITFRHGDGNVLAQILPVMGITQLARFSGPADMVSFHPEPKWGKAPLTLGKRESDAEIPTGPLALTVDNMQAVGALRMRAYDKLFYENLLQDYPDLKSQDQEILKKKITFYRHYAYEKYHIKAECFIYEYLCIAIAFEQQSRNDRYIDQLLKRIDPPIKTKMRILRARYAMKHRG